MSENVGTVVNFGFELGQLRICPRTGWFRILQAPESLADHTARATQIAFLLATSEKHPNPELVATMVAFHEIGEARCHDLDHVARIYVKRDEKRAVRDQTKELGVVGERIYEMWCEVESGETQSGCIAKDADSLENAFTARELLVQGNKDAQQWLDSIGPRLKTSTAKAWFDELVRTDPNEWWKSLLR